MAVLGDHRKPGTMPKSSLTTFVVELGLEPSNIEPQTHPRQNVVTFRMGPFVGLDAYIVLSCYTFSI